MSRQRPASAGHGPAAGAGHAHGRTPLAGLALVCPPAMEKPGREVEPAADGRRTTQAQVQDRALSGAGGERHEDEPRDVWNVEGAWRPEKPRGLVAGGRWRPAPERQTGKRVGERGAGAGSRGWAPAWRRCRPGVEGSRVTARLRFRAPDSDMACEARRTSGTSLRALKPCPECRCKGWTRDRPAIPGTAFGRVGCSLGGA